MQELWTVEYSVEQKCFHIDTLDSTIKNNIQSIVEGKTTSYMLIFICATHEEAKEYVEKAGEILKAWNEINGTENKV